MLEKCSQLKSRGKDIIYCWIPSHIGIEVNEEADKAAKVALSLNEAPKQVLTSDLGNEINNLLHEGWQQEWEAESNMLIDFENKLSDLSMLCKPMYA